MKIIVPMAGMGKRLRPHTLLTPKPLFPIAGKPIAQRLVEDLARLSEGKVDEIVFVVGRFGAEAERQLVEVAEGLGAKGTIAYQDEALGTAHAVFCAKEAMDGPVIIAFADTIFRAGFSIDDKADGVIWVRKVEDPRRYGVVTLDEAGAISGMVEKPEQFVSDLAIIGIYYVKDGPGLREEIQRLIDGNIKSKGEFQLTDALDNLRAKGARFLPGEVDEWLDCGNKELLLNANRCILDEQNGQSVIADDAEIESATLVPPCYVGAGAKIKDSVVGPHASIGERSVVEASVVRGSIVRNDARLSGVYLEDSIVGNFAKLERPARTVSLGDYSTE